MESLVGYGVEENSNGFEYSLRAKKMLDIAYCAAKKHGKTKNCIRTFALCDYKTAGLSCYEGAGEPWNRCFGNKTRHFARIKLWN